MRFVKTDELKDGLKLAKPIYNKKGVLLYERGSKLTGQGISAVQNFGLMGVYVLDPAEPPAPMTPEERDFERFQAVSEIKLMVEMAEMIRTGQGKKMRDLAEAYFIECSRATMPISFVQNLRSVEDYVVKHSANVALLSALISRTMGMYIQEQTDVILAALLHEVGKFKLPPILLSKKKYDEKDIEQLKALEMGGFDIIGECFMSMPAIRRTVVQTFKHLDALDKEEEKENGKMVDTAKVMAVAETFDRLTAVSFTGEPISYISALRYMLDKPEWFDRDVVMALSRSIVFLREGTAVTLTDGKEALVLAPNREDMFKPIVLIFEGNKAVDLSRTAIFRGLEVKDTIKTFDSRYVMDSATIEELKQGVAE